MPEVFLTGGLGFIGSNLSDRLLDDGYRVTCFDSVDRLSVSKTTIDELTARANFNLFIGDLRNSEDVVEAVSAAKPDIVIHLGGISSVDRSIRDPRETININVLGTVNLLEAMRSRGVRRLHYVSTDEVFGQISKGSFNENSPNNPRNPYAAGKAAAEAMTLAWGATYGMEVTITSSVNNFGSRQAPDKLIPRLTLRGLLGNTLPVYGDGKQIREWLFVDDHINAIMRVSEQGKFGEKYCVGSGQSLANIEIVSMIMQILGLESDRIEYVVDRLGHDQRYEVDSTKIQQLGWKPHSDGIRTDLEEVITWYKQREDWWQHFVSVYPDLCPKT